MNADLYGIDSLYASNEAALENFKSSSYVGSAPSFWGRYFYAPGQMNSSGQKDSHYSSDENALLRSNGIRVLPIARQTTHVMDTTRAETDAVNNVDALLEVFPASYLAGADPNVLFFLDVEIETPMTADYYSAWSNKLIDYGNSSTNGSVNFRPSIYGSTKDNQTWQALLTASNAGAKCFGLLIDRYYYGSPTPRGWLPNILTPSVHVDPPILAWQYWASADDAESGFNFDANIISPYHADAMLDGLVMPPGPPLVA